MQDGETLIFPANYFMNVQVCRGSMGLEMMSQVNYSDSINTFKVVLPGLRR